VCNNIRSSIVLCVVVIIRWVRNMQLDHVLYSVLSWFMRWIRNMQQNQIKYCTVCRRDLWAEFGVCNNTRSSIVLFQRSSQITSNSPHTNHYYISRLHWVVVAVCCMLLHSLNTIQYYSWYCAVWYKTVRLQVFFRIHIMISTHYYDRMLLHTSNTTYYYN